ncbi:MAG: hypothetical protein RLY31_966, partial [Bacteroidota bacterium]
MDTARTELHVQTYILTDDHTGGLVLEAMLRARGRGVDTFLLLDAFGSGNLPRVLVARLKESGVRLRFFSPLFTYKGRFFGRRLHHKVILADRQVAIIGGINFSDSYSGFHGETPWLDFAVLLHGEECRLVHKVCVELWGKVHPVTRFPFRRERYLPSVRLRTLVIHNDWFRYRNQVDVRYRTMLREAKQQILIVAGYFLPGFRFRRALERAVGRGVRVRIVLAGQSDVRMLRYASRHLYGALLEWGVEIYEWHGSVLHAKAMMVDHAWMTLGSFNLNYLSTYGSIETNIESTERALLRDFSRSMQSVLARCEKVTDHVFSGRAVWWHRWRDAFAYHLMRRALLLLTFFAYKRM